MNIEEMKAKFDEIKKIPSVTHKVNLDKAWKDKDFIRRSAVVIAQAGIADRNASISEKMIEANKEGNEAWLKYLFEISAHLNSEYKELLDEESELNKKINWESLA